jgi:hypothetical protein
VHALFSFRRPVFYFPLGCACSVLYLVVFVVILLYFLTVTFVWSLLYAYSRVFSWSLGLFIHACMFCLPLYLLPDYLLRFSTFPNILTGVGCIYSFFVFATTPLYHSHFFSFLTLVLVVFWLVIFFRFHLIICQLGC